MATYAAFKHVELHKIGYGKNRVPNAPRGCISEIFRGDQTDGAGVGVRNGRVQHRAPRDTPTRPRDTHSRLFGQAPAQPPMPLVTDTVRSNIKFGDSELPNGNGIASPSKSPLTNGSAASTPSRGETVAAADL